MKENENKKPEELESTDPVMTDHDGSTEDAPLRDPYTASNKKTAIIAGAAIVCALLISGGAAFAGITIANSNNAIQSTIEQTEDNSSNSSSSEDKKETSEAVHTHDWVAEYETVHHDAETHTVHHDAQYEEQLVNHTVCNTCGEIIDGKAAEHIKNTGHKGYTKNVPKAEKVLVKEAYDETITDKAAYDESVLKDYKCSTCGVTATPEEVQTDESGQVA